MVTVLALRDDTHTDIRTAQAVYMTLKAMLVSCHLVNPAMNQSENCDGWAVW